jgi:asparagine synthase (glutamine-hydrolysing)
MCGIAGVVKFATNAEVDGAVLRRMCAAMVHRGPDDEGVYLGGRVGLGVRRLSVIDLVTGHQPISNEDGTVWIVFNGEIYNHATLRERLRARGHRYATQSDTETIIHAYEEYGRDCVRHLRGMFAFAIWDTRKRRLFLARDRLGIKPLYYRENRDSFFFGSEIKVILAHPDVHAEFNRSSLPEFLAFGYLSGEGTFYKGIRKLMPGHTLELDENGKLRIERYWDLAFTADSKSHPSSITCSPIVIFWSRPSAVI